MKKKFLVICIILAVILSITAFTAALVPRIADNPATDTEDTGDEMIRFYFDGEKYMVKKGTTFISFVTSNIDTINANAPDTVEYCFSYKPDRIEYSVGDEAYYLCIDPNSEIKAGEEYGCHSYITFSIEDKEYTVHNGATWGYFIEIAEGEFFEDYPVAEFDESGLDSGNGYYIYSSEDGNDEDHVHANDLIQSQTYYRLK